MALPMKIDDWPLRADRADVACCALLWPAGFALCAIRCWPVLTCARVDGGAG